MSCPGFYLLLNLGFGEIVQLKNVSVLYFKFTLSLGNGIIRGFNRNCARGFLQDQEGCGFNDRALMFVSCGKG